MDGGGGAAATGQVQQHSCQHSFPHKINDLAIGRGAAAGAGGRLEKIPTRRLF
jgi:hypothetical protein